MLPPKNKIPMFTFGKGVMRNERPMPNRPLLGEKPDNAGCSFARPHINGPGEDRNLDGLHPHEVG